MQARVKALEAELAEYKAEEQLTQARLKRFDELDFVAYSQGIPTKDFSLFNDIRTEDVRVYKPGRDGTGDDEYQRSWLEAWERSDNQEEKTMESTSKTNQGERAERWPALPFEAWKDTCETLHMWTQIVGKVRMELSPFVNHWWHVTLYVTPRGLTTSPIPYRGSTFDVAFDFIDHTLLIRTSAGTSKAMPLIPRTVAAFYQEFMACLQALGIEVAINTLPSEVQHPIRYDQDEVHGSYDPVYVQCFWRILMQVDQVFKEFRSPFLGKCSPVHFFWGSFDLAVTRFSGRRAPERPGVDRITREAYSHEVISCGFWPGDETFKAPAFYSYTVPAPPGLQAASLRPSAAWYSPDKGEFLLRYDDVRSTDAPEQVLQEFLQSTYEAGATLAHWDRQALEREAPSPDGTQSES
jgi:Family of unknown function (DUF5996)